MMETTIVIPQRGLGALTNRCLELLRRDEPGCPVIVVDDGSPDDSAAVVAERGWQQVTVLQQPARGVSAAWNVGVEAATTEGVVLLNNDVVVQGAWVERLMAAVAGGDGRMAGVRWRRERQVPASVRASWPTDRLLEGWCWGFRRSTWQSLGGFDETLRVYWSDTLFQWRGCRRWGGESLRCVTDLPLRHEGHATIGRDEDRKAIWLRDRATFLQRLNGEES